MVQFYAEFDPEISGAYFESSAFSDASEQLVVIAERLGLSSHFDFFSFAEQNDMCAPEDQETEVLWFDPRAGIDWLQAIIGQVRANPGSVPDPDKLLIDFTQCLDVLERANSAGSKWHFAMDI